jgi:tetratricopeptide (TPR) repeat protein
MALAASAAATAHAKPRSEPPAARTPERRDIWRRITDPNGDEVRALVGKARLSMRYADDSRAGDEDWAIEQRTRFYRDAYNLTAHARKLAPENLEALAAFARAADELGHTAEAIGALELSAKLTGPDKASVDVVARLGAMYLRTGDTDQAIRWLRRAQGAVSIPGDELDQAHAIVHLATVLAARGEVAAAIHTIAAALPERPLGRISRETTALTFALAVLYDRDEQRTSAFKMLAHLQATLTDQYQAEVQLELARMPFLPPEDLHYYRALLYESLDHYVEARAEWALYAAAGRPTYRGRALDHIAAIDASAGASIRASAGASIRASIRGHHRASPRPKRPQQFAPSRAILRRLPGP